jgi:hypothetical protein
MEEPTINRAQPTIRRQNMGKAKTAKASEGDQDNWLENEETETQVETPKISTKKHIKDKVKAESTTKADDIGLNDEEPTMAKGTKSIKKAKPVKAAKVKKAAKESTRVDPLAGKFKAAKVEQFREGSVRRLMAEAFKNGKTLEQASEADVELPRSKAMKKNRLAHWRGYALFLKKVGAIVKA